MSAELPRVERDEHGLPVFFHHCVDGLLRMVTLEGWCWTPDNRSLNPHIACRACETAGVWAGDEWVPVPWPASLDEPQSQPRYPRDTP